MDIDVLELGELTCRVVPGRRSSSQPARLGVVFCHGYGATGTDLVPLAEALIEAEPQLADGVHFLFPEAPRDLAELGMPFGRAWWPLSVQRLQAQLQSGDFAAIRETIPPGIDEARLALTNAIDAWRTTLNLERSSIVLGGFSQGAMISVETAAAWETPPRGLIALSGTLIHESAWRAGLARKSDLPVFQSHGEQDFVLPYIGAEWLRAMFQDVGADLQFCKFRGGHEIPWPVLEGVAEFLKARLSS